MKAIITRSFGGPEVLEWADVPTPVAGAEEVLIKVAAAGMNRADVMQRQGRYPPPPGVTDIMGLEVAGEVAAVGASVTRWKIGDRVCALLAGGGYAEYVAVYGGHCLPVPQHLTFVQAAVLPECLITVWANLFEAGALQPHETALVHGGSSGIGTTAIQLAKLSGAKIFVTVKSDDKVVACSKLGADLAINYVDNDFVAAVERATAGQGVNVVLDMIGGDYVPRNLACLAPLGRHVSISTQQGRSTTLDLRLVMQKRLVVTGSTLRPRSKAEKARLVGEVEAKAWPWVLSGQVNPLIYQACSIKDVAEAHKVMESGVHIGKIALEVAA